MRKGQQNKTVSITDENQGSNSAVEELVEEEEEGKKGDQIGEEQRLK